MFTTLLIFCVNLGFEGRPCLSLRCQVLMQIENLLAEDKTREAIFLSGSSQELFSQLRTMAQATIENPSSHHGSPTIAVSPVLAYVKFAMYVALDQSSEGCHPPGSAEGSGRKANMSTATPTRRTSEVSSSVAYMSNLNSHYAP